jgi:hypothetical protein
MPLVEDCRKTREHLVEELRIPAGSLRWQLAAQGPLPRLQQPAECRDRPKVAQRVAKFAVAFGTTGHSPDGHGCCLSQH